MEPETEDGRETQLRGAQVKLESRERERGREGEREREGGRERGR